MSDLLRSPAAGSLFVAGCKTNQGRFYAEFDHVALLSAPVDLLFTRIAARSDNPYLWEDVRRTRDDPSPYCCLDLIGRRAVIHLAMWSAFNCQRRRHVLGRSTVSKIGCIANTGTDPIAVVLRSRSLACARQPLIPVGNIGADSWY
jgi:hypothetical protein